MKNLKIARGIMIGLCTLLLAGCSTESNKDNHVDVDTQKSTPDAPVTKSSEDANYTDSDDANALIDLSAIQGSVIRFSDTGCSISQVSSEDGGQSAKVAAPGNETADTTVNINYSTNCEFQIAAINSSTGKASIHSASISDIKKQTSLIIYGDFQDTHNLTATKVIIARYA